LLPLNGRRGGGVVGMGEEKGKYDEMEGDEEVESEEDYSVCVHDAFVVKYQYGADDDSSDSTPHEQQQQQRPQRQLPLHTDQSTHSLTIALNSLTDYSGGGTFFADLNDAVRPGIMWQFERILLYLLVESSHLWQLAPIY
jgi:hypothetical protein